MYTSSMLILMNKVLLDLFVVVWSTPISLTVRGAACTSPPESNLRITLFPMPQSTIQFVLILASGKQWVKS
jgi:hypothetical protein